MKTKTLRTLFYAALGLLAGSPLAGAQTTAFSYQGKLEDNGHPATGLYDLDFALFASPMGGSALSGTSTRLVTPVTNGLFTVALDFGSSPFDGSARYLEISVRTNGASTAPVPLLPRTLLGSAPYATYAQKAASVADSSIKAAQLASGAVVKSLNGLKDDVVLAPGNNITLATNGNTLTVSATGGSGDIWSANALGTYYSGGKVGIGTATPLEKLHVNGTFLRVEGAGGEAAYIGGDGVGGEVHVGSLNPNISKVAIYNSASSSWMDVLAHDQTLFGNLYCGNQVRQNLNLWGTEYGIGVQAANLYQRSHGGFAWHQQGVHSDAHYDPGAGGRLLMSLDENGLNVGANGDFAGNLNAHSISIPGGFGSRANQGEFVVNDYFSLAGPYDLPPRFVVKQNANVGIGTAAPTEKLHVHGKFLRVDGSGGEAVYIGGDGNGDVQIGSLNPLVSLVSLYNAGANTWMELAGQEATMWGDYHMSSDAHGAGYRNTYAGSYIDGPVLYGYNGGGLGVSQPDDLTLTWDWHGNVWVKNNLNTCNLTIRGGCDLAEPFQMKEENIEKGSVVVIDDQNAGGLQLSSRAYDTRVAGIVSGANGINPGIALHQEGMVEGGQNVALTGRVYVKADASYGAIKPGDLLTTSNTPGHAMKVTDHALAQGAILGKAMSALPAGTGMVLVLVTLQ